MAFQFMFHSFKNLNIFQQDNGKHLENRCLKCIGLKPQEQGFIPLEFNKLVF